MSAHLCNVALAERVCAAVADCGGPIRVGNGKQLDAEKKSLSPALQGVRSSIRGSESIGYLNQHLLTTW